MKVYVVYLITNSANGKQYVGLDSSWPKRRAEHLYSMKNGKHKNRHIQRAAAKYGPAAFVFSVLEVCDTKEEVKQRERAWIAELGTRTNGYNLTDGGDGVCGYVMSQKQKDAIGARSRGRVATAETRASISAGLHRAIASGRRKPGKGLQLQTPAVWAKISAANRGEGSGRAIMTEGAVLQLRAEWQSGQHATKAQLCRDYSQRTGAGYYAVFDALSGKTWSHLPNAVATSGLMFGRIAK